MYKRQVLKILKRDLLRLLKTPQALVVVFALMVIPSLYTWYNVIGFWNPYDNTGNLTVCVVNQDAGGSSELTGELNAVSYTHLDVYKRQTHYRLV